MPEPSRLNFSLPGGYHGLSAPTAFLSGLWEPWTLDSVDTQELGLETPATWVRRVTTTPL